MCFTFFFSYLREYKLRSFPDILYQDVQIQCIGVGNQGLNYEPFFYDREIAYSVVSNSPTELSKTLLKQDDMKAYANAQNRCGENLLMKVCRNLDKNHCTDVFKVLLNAGANVFVCCDSSKTFMHDLFWSARGLNEEPKAASQILGILKLILDKYGLAPCIRLLTFPDRHGFTPLDYIMPDCYAIGTKFIDFVFSHKPTSKLSVGCGEATGCKKIENPLSSAKSSLGKPPSTFEMASLLEKSWSGCTFTGYNLSKLAGGLRKEDFELLKYLCLNDHSFLLSDANDPDAAIVCASNVFCKTTGYSMEEVLGRNCRFLQGPETSHEHVRMIRRSLEINEALHVNILNYKKNNQPFVNNFYIAPLYKDSKCALYVGIQNSTPETRALYHPYTKN